MLKKTLSLALALVMALGLFCIPASAATSLDLQKLIPTDFSVKIDPQYAETDSYYGSVIATFKADGLKSDYDNIGVVFNFEYKIGDAEWNSLYEAASEIVYEYQTMPGIFNVPCLWTGDKPWDGVTVVSFRVCVNWYWMYEGTYTVSPTTGKTGYSNIASLGLHGSGWAIPELKKADQYGLIPDMLKGADLTKPITRREFAAVAVKLYENLSGNKAAPAATNPFTDTNDIEVLKAYNVGLTAGTAADKFSPDVLLNREQAATMLVRVLKACYIGGWTLSTDGSFTLNFTMPPKFADDAKISDWAKPSVYFAAANGIIAGTGNNNFSPRDTTPAEEAMNYASATREQALAIAVRMVDNLKNKPLDYTKN